MKTTYAVVTNRIAGMNFYLYDQRRSQTKYFDFAERFDTIAEAREVAKAAQENPRFDVQGIVRIDEEGFEATVSEIMLVLVATEQEPSSVHEQLMEQTYARWQEHDVAVRAEYEPRIAALIESLGEDGDYHSDVYKLRREAKEKMWDLERFWAQLDERETVAVLTGNMNAQVCNGGWAQWCDNGYVECASALEEILRKQIGTRTAVEAAAMVATVARAHQEYEEARNATPEIDYCTCDEEEECCCETQEDIEEGAREEFCMTAEPLDSRYYQINEVLMQEIEIYLNGGALERYEAPVEEALSAEAPSTPAESSGRLTDIRCKLVGRDGNAWSIMGFVAEALKRGGRRDLIEPFRKEAMNGDYDHLLQTAMKYVDVC